MRSTSSFGATQSFRPASRFDPTAAFPLRWSRTCPLWDVLPRIFLDIEKALAKFIRDPVVTVVVTSFQGPYSEQIRIIGEAAKPQAISYRQNMTLLDVMIQVGGLTDFADGNSAVLVRGTEKNKQYGIRLKDLLRRGDISANVDVKPGDVIIIPQSWF